MTSVKSIWPSFSDEEADAVAAVIRSNRVNYWTGDIGRAFEREFAGWAGTDHAIALANGTLALDVALKALGVGPGDEVIVTPRTFIASISCVVMPAQSRYSRTSIVTAATSVLRRLPRA